ncbi:low-specificity L-threonine aldolase [Thermotoga sp. KOL6]|uniref:low-specificity L-threonine aldolase n=1 Tax=Thermotoga sp. KOL6 TaxID=126741 RepID=UPI000C7766B1|nr:low-specificity L-threonine aldolase [Thermotoga sp. KOL6]PLV59997.1 threonine aldolase [Thermotoga sp. KOL6]
MVDLRSDTVTKPTLEMRKAMMEAKVGDDGYGEDPTVNELETLAAEIFGKEAALFVPSGTMGNLVSIMALTQRGESAIVEAKSHIFLYEVGSISALCGVMPYPLSGINGVLDPDMVKKSIVFYDIHRPRTSLIAIENTHNFAGGRVIPLENMKEIYEIAKERVLNVHLDGARIFNASVASGISVKEYAKYADSVMFCLSKGLCAPVGSVVVGSKDFIEKARKMRQMVGGGMRQAGVLAAAGIVALTKMVDRLKEDHENAKFLAGKLRKIGYIVDPDQVETNIVLLRTDNIRVTAREFQRIMKDFEILVSVISDTTVRLVTHKDVTRRDIEESLNAFEEVFRMYGS